MLRDLIGGDAPLAVVLFIFVIGMACGWQARTRLHPVPRSERRHYWQRPVEEDERDDDPPPARRIEVVSEVEALPLFDATEQTRR